MIAIEIKRLTKYYPGKCALNNVSFEVKKNSIHGFLGPNGAGKTTTMNILSCLLKQSEGNVLVEGLNSTERKETVKRLIGFLPEEPPLYEDMTVEDFLEFKAKLFEVPKNKLGESIERVIDKLSLGPMRTKRISVLSKGYKQRVGIASAIIHNPKVLILDEPVVGLDPVAIREIRELLVELKSDHTILFSSHQLNEVSQICDDLTFIKDGEIIRSDSYDNIIKKVEVSDYILILKGEMVKTVLEAHSDLLSIDDDGDKKKVEVRLSSKDEISNLIKKLIENKIDIFECRSKESHLEDIFINMMDNHE